MAGSGPLQRSIKANVATGAGFLSKPLKPQLCAGEDDMRSPDRLQNSNAL